VTIGRPAIGDIDDFDILWLQQHADAETEVLARAYKEAGKKVVYDVDDWLFAMPPSWPAYDYFFTRGTGHPTNAIGFYERLLGLADVVTTTTSYLAEKILKKFPKADVRVLPNFIMAGDWDTMSRLEHNLDGPVLGWFGTGNHWDDWVETAHILDRVLADTGGYMAVMGSPEVLACFPERLAKKVQLHSLMSVDKLPTLRRLITACDVGLSWVSDRIEAGLCRSPLKALQWGAAGVPLVASRTIYDKIPSAESFFALSDLENLEETLGVVLGGARDESAEDWKEKVLAEYSYETQAHRWIDVLVSVSR